MTRWLSRPGFWCDAPECNESYEEFGSAITAWVDASEQGWRMQSGGHYCPVHAMPGYESMGH